MGQGQGREGIRKSGTTKEENDLDRSENYRTYDYIYIVFGKKKICNES